MAVDVYIDITIRGGNMWNEARQAIESIFFKDKIRVYELVYTETELGEDVEQETLFGDFNCNIEAGQSLDKETIVGHSTPQTLRISTIKDIGLNYSKRYKLQVLQARLSNLTEDTWIIDGWTEAQLSTVLAVSREVAV